MPKKKHLLENDDDNLEESANKDEFGLDDENSDKDEEINEFEDESAEFDEENEELEEGDEIVENVEIFEEEDEPDLLDNSGQLWKFVCRIGDSQDLEEFMGRMDGQILKKEDNKKWNKFGCAENGGACPFQTIYLKSCANLYSRGEHNHGKEKDQDNGISSKIENNESVDAAIPKHYQFYANIKNEAHLEEIVEQNELCVTAKRRGDDELMRNYYECKQNWKFRKNSHQHPDSRLCTFHGIYDLKKQQFYTTKTGHNHHELEAKNSFEIGKDYVDKFGKYWKFCNEINKNVADETLRIEYGFNTILPSKQGFYLYCNKSTNGKKCKFAGIYLDENECLYTRGRHEHEVEMDKRNVKKALKIGNDYVDRRGKLWKFFGEIGKNATMEMMRIDYGFPIIQTTKQGFYLQCSKTAGIKGKCKYAGVYLRENGCLYTRGQHEHAAKLEMREKKKPLIKELISPEAGGNSFLDRFGNLWPFATQIDKNLKENEFPSKFDICRIRRTNYGFYFHCIRKGQSSTGKCRFRAIYVESSGNMYAKTLEHDDH